MADDDIELTDEAPKKSKLKLIILGMAGMFVIVGITVGGLFAGGLLKMPESSSASSEASAEEAEAEKPDALYIAMEPAFTVTFTDPGDSKFLQLSLKAMTRDPDVESSLTRHMPMIRNDVMLLFSSKSPSDLVSRSGKEALQAETLASIQDVLERVGGSGEIEAVYFTTFVMQ